MKNPQVDPEVTTNTRAQLDPDDHLLQAVAAANPEIPFQTPAYVQARMLRNERPAAFLATAGDDRYGCTGFVVEGRVHRDLNIISAPPAPGDHAFWGMIRDFCAQQRITRLRVQSFGSIMATIPKLGRETLRTQRREFVLELGPECPPLTLSSNHRRNLRRAERTGLQLRETSDPDASETHAALIDASMSRRLDRGEGVSTGTSPDTFRYFLATGAATLFQAHDPQNGVLSSLLVLKSARGAYYHSAGTSPEGMSAGASQFMIATVAQSLRDRGITRFNLGGAAEDQTGLARFKSGFRPATVELETATFDMTHGALRAVIATAEAVRAHLTRWRSP